jgi:hypothetical protein
MSNLLKIAQFSEELDKIAEDIQKEDPRIALALDQINDNLEKSAMYPMGWIPGRIIAPLGKGRYVWDPGQRIPSPAEKEHPKEARWELKCPKCGASVVAYDWGNPE